jgi:hypothetical protein
MEKPRLGPAPQAIPHDARAICRDAGLPAALVRASASLCLCVSVVKSRFGEDDTWLRSEGRWLG